MLVLFTDTDTDLTPAEAAHYGYHLISMPYSIDCETVYPFESKNEPELKSFYNTLRKGVIPTTSAISPERYKQYFEPVFAAGNDILYVHFSTAMSKTFDNMEIALRDLREQYPDRRIYTVDTKGITVLSLNIVKEIGDLYLAGKTVEEILAWAEEEVQHFALYFFADDLRFFRRSGRVSGLAARMGDLIGVRPIIYVNPDGQMVNIGREVGRAKALNRLVSYVDELGDRVTEHRFVIGHTDAPELAQKLADSLRAKYGADCRIEIVCVNPTIGSHCGPNGVGVCFHCTHR